MKVLMFGWEFPPYNSGGLGTACEGLTKGLAQEGEEVIFVLPHAPEDINPGYMRVLLASKICSNNSNIKIKKVDSLLMPYLTSEKYDEKIKNLKRFGIKDGNYGRNIYEESERYAEQAGLIAEEEDFDVIHAHDWMTYRAGIKAKEASGKPLVIHVHATEFDRTGGNNNQYIYDIEREGMHKADMIITVSNYTKNKVIEHYGVDPEKIYPVHNAVEFNDFKLSEEEFKLKDNNKIVLFLGRITIQKGPDWFLGTAKRVLEKDKNIKFIIAGSGDMENSIIEKSAELGIADHVLFAGFLRGIDIDRAYSLADLYVMPSISEPFGITPLEAMRNETPVLISKQSGVSEVLDNAIKVDFWDIEKMSDEIVNILNDKERYEMMKRYGSEEVKKFDWKIPARKCINVYNKARGMI